MQVLIPNALQPAEVEEVILCQMLGRAIVLVQEDQLSLAIGRRGQNVRLASKLCGWDIEIMTREELDEQIEQAVAGYSSLEGVEPELAERLVGEGFLSYDDLSVIEPDALAEMGGLSPELVEAHRRPSRSQGQRGRAGRRRAAPPATRTGAAGGRRGGRGRGQSVRLLRRRKAGRSDRTSGGPIRLPRQSPRPASRPATAMRPRCRRKARRRRPMTPPINGETARKRDRARIRRNLPQGAAPCPSVSTHWRNNSSSTAKVLVDICTKAGVTDKGSALASLTDEETARVMAYITGGKGARPGAPAGPARRSDTAAGTAFRREDYIAPAGMAPGKVPVLPSKPEKPARQEEAGNAGCPARCPSGCAFPCAPRSRRKKNRRKKNQGTKE